MLQRIDFFKNKVSQYGVLESFTKGLQQALRRAHIRSRTFDHLKQSPSYILASFVKNRPDCTAGFNAIMPPHAFWEPLNIPHLSLIVDSASYYPELLQCKSSICAFSEEDSCIFFQMLGMKSVFLFPHAIERKWLDTAAYQKRDLDLVMCGSYHDPEACRIPWKEHLSKKTQHLLEEMAQEVLSSPHLSHLEIFLRQHHENAAFAQELREREISLFGLMSSFEHYLRALDRIAFLQALDGVDIHIFGAKQYESEWKKALHGKKRLFFHPEVPYSDLPFLFRRARCVLNSIPTIKRGWHERLLLALSQGASVLTNENVFIPHIFPQSHAVMHVKPPNYAQGSDLLKTAFQNEDARLDAVLSCQKVIFEQHTFDARVSYLQEVLPTYLA